MTLDEYRSKRTFDRTPEPKPKGRQRARSKSDSKITRSRFVIHKHGATHLHFDLRLEIEGVLKCWAIPRGPSIDPGQRRLAIQTEDHPLDYLQFEGLIPAGNYGAGPMIIWDRGQWSFQGAQRGFEDGKLKLLLEGERLRGGWTLVRSGDVGSKQWLMIKERDRWATPVTQLKLSDRVEAEPVISLRTSVASGRTLEGMKAEHVPAMRNNKAEVIHLQDLPTIQPKLPSLVEQPPRGEGWLHELKLDGYRMLARWAGGEVELLTRNGQDWTDRLPELADSIAALPAASGILDGELVALAADGRPDFAALQASFRNQRTAPLRMFFFDLLYLDGSSWMEQPLRKRKERLAKLLRVGDTSRLQYLDHVEGSGVLLWQQCQQRELEGLVSKRIDNRYRGGRAKDWLKAKCRRRDRFVIGGYEASRNALGGLGALAVGYFSPDGALVFCGKVGSGWSQQTGSQLRQRLERLAKPESSFEPPPDVRLQWVDPRVAVEVDFSGVTRDGRLRQASLVGIESSLPAASVIREGVTLDIAEGDLPASSVNTDRPQIRGRSTSQASTTRDEATTPQLEKLLKDARITNPQRILFPEAGLTKLDLVHYLVLVSQWLLPHIAGRPLSLVRCPNGIQDETFFQRHAKTGFPPQVRSQQIADEKKPLIRIDTVEGLVAAAQMNVVEFHPWGSRFDRPDRPDRIVIDLDPDVELPWPEIVDAAWIVRQRLLDSGLTSFVKTTGGKGVHIVVPIERRYAWERVGEWVGRWVDHLVKDERKRFTGTSAKRARRGKIYLDHLRNRRSATHVAAYSVRARESAPVSVPLAWSELTAELRPLDFTIETLPARLRNLEVDPWESIKALRQRLS